MSRHTHKCHYAHSSLLALTIVVSSSLSLIFFLSNEIYAQNESNIISPQEPNQVGEQRQIFQNGTSLIMTTDQTIYSPGETVNFTMTNTGEEPLTFPNSALGLMIRNLATNESYPIYSAQVITTLNPNESSSVIWDTVASNGNPVLPGDYIASVRSGSSTTNVIFSIVKQIP
jgi:hypothetical protein